LVRFDGTVLVVSHDRDFVDAFATAVLHFEHQTLQRYAGGWSAFERQQSERQRLQRKLADSQTQRIAKLEQFVARFRAQATKAKQAQSRVKALERIERIVLVEDETAASMRFDSPDQMPEQIASLVEVDCGYPANPPITIVRRAQLDLRRGDRIGVLGRNGAGKSTLVRTLVAELDPLTGDRCHARALRIGYFAQRQVETLDPQASALEHLKRIETKEREQVLREFLAGFGFRGEQAMTPVAPFSGGEKARLALALIAWTRPQLLVLDEPTNHLDASARDALTAALADYEGALLLVSHDRGLLRATVDRFVIVANGQLSPFDGDLEDYREWLADQARKSDSNSGLNPPKDRANQPSLPLLSPHQQRQQNDRLRKPLLSKLQRVEREMSQLQRTIEQLDTQLADPAFMRIGAQVVETHRTRSELASQLDKIEGDWLSLTSDLEALCP
jgi:ATP-binding cassette subfamily F protein 3